MHMIAKVPIAAAPAVRLALFGPPPLIEGEDAAAYDELLARMCAAVKPVDIIDEMYVADVVSLEWEILRWRRLKFTRLQQGVHFELQDFLDLRLNYDAYAEAFSEILADTLAEILAGTLAKNLTKNLAKNQAKELAHQYARSQPDAVKEAGVLLKAAGLQADKILEQAKAQRAKELAREYARREPDAIKQVREVLASNDSRPHGLAIVLESRSNRAARSPNYCRRGSQKRQPVRDRSASCGARRSAAAERARS